MLHWTLLHYITLRYSILHYMTEELSPDISLCRDKAAGTQPCTDHRIFYSGTCCSATVITLTHNKHQPYI